ncbi:hypothetical protein HOD20_02925 [archaeon]|jgi:hypothetical protein|nr:hypothetical protein [archaeon]MBT4351458.1 hypothetical protein [archaeon]MBT4647740.1 hypothetical protein [archaeon]MBT6821268.1 hypothetical protein [archaeon]MBT7392055.1 hypothetical protein [archaeon]
MIHIKKFEDYVNEGIIRKVTSDTFRSKSLIIDSNKRKIFLDEIENKIGVKDENSNYFIENCYDIIIQLLRSKLILNGYKASGQGAHIAEVSYMKKIGFLDEDMYFMNELRHFRNGIKYYGKRFDKEYANKTIKFMKKCSKFLENQK